jgi:uncharacterized protein YukE
MAVFLLRRGVQRGYWYGTGSMSAENGYKRWNDEMDACLVGLVTARVKIDEIASEMGRTRLAILQRIGKLHDEGFLGGFL